MGENCIYLNILAKKDKYIVIWKNTREGKDERSKDDCRQ